MDRCTFCGGDAMERTFLARAPSTDAAICGACLAIAFRALEVKKGLLPSPGVARLIGGVTMWPLERRLRQFNHAYWRARAAVRRRLFSARRAEPSPSSSLFTQRVHPLKQFEKRCAMCGGRDQLIPTPKGARICEACVESWTRTLLG